MNKIVRYFYLFILVQFFISSCADGRTNIEITELWENGAPKTEIQWFNKADSTYRQLHYFENGQLRLSKIFSKGNLEKLTGYYETGEIEASFIFENNELIAGSEYYKNGQKMGEVPTELDGTINGPVKYYYENGNLRSAGEYKNDKPHGLWREYDEKGNISSEKHYDNGIEIK